ncbi:MAG TPA: T9SS type A sorting domain-containing protein [Candidatus Kapabacteria bacterium]|nr:T9SS type A sorting domain-containing protein [Candidatus Kapabacteria bacterium]
MEKIIMKKMNMRTNILFLAAIIVLLILVLTSLGHAQVRMDRAVISNAGGRTSSHSTTMDYTIGQTVTGTASSTNTNGAFGFWTNGGVTSGITPGGAGAISSISISPNPATNSADVAVSLASSGRLDLELYDASGKLVTTIYSADRTTGNFSAHIDTKQLASGAYYLAARMPGSLLETQLEIVR